MSTGIFDINGEEIELGMQVMVVKINDNETEFKGFVTDWGEGRIVVMDMKDNRVDINSEDYTTEVIILK